MKHLSFSRLGPVLLGLMLPASIALADTPVTYTEAGRALFRFEAPDFWSVRTGGPRDLTAPGTEEARSVSRVIGMQPETDPRLWVGFISPYGVRNFDDAAAYLTDIGPFLVKNAKVDSRKDRKIAGRPAKTVAGHGNRNGRTVNFTAVMIDLPNGRMAISVVVMESGLDAASVAEVNDIFASFRAVE